MMDKKVVVYSSDSWNGGQGRGEDAPESVFLIPDPDRLHHLLTLIEMHQRLTHGIPQAPADGITEQASGYGRDRAPQRHAESSVTYFAGVISGNIFMHVFNACFLNVIAVLLIKTSKIGRASCRERV